MTDPSLKYQPILNRGQKNIIIIVGFVIVLLIFLYFFGRPNVDKILPGTSAFIADQIAESTYIEISQNTAKKAEKAIAGIDERMNEIAMIQSSGRQELLGSADIAMDKTVEKAEKLIAKVNNHDKQQELLLKLSQNIIGFVGKIVDDDLQNGTNKNIAEKQMDHLNDVINKLSTENKILTINNNSENLAKIAKELPKKVREIIEQVPDSDRNQLNDSINQAIKEGEEASGDKTEENNQPTTGATPYAQIENLKITDVTGELNKLLTHEPYYVSNINLIEKKGMFSAFVCFDSEDRLPSDEILGYIFVNKGEEFENVIVIDSESALETVYNQNLQKLGTLTLNEFLWLAEQSVKNLQPSDSQNIPIIKYNN